MSDVVSLHCPLNEETEGMVDTTFLCKMAKNAALVNTARGKILRSLEDLHVHLHEHPEFRAALDVLPKEPPEDHPLIMAWRENASWLGGRLMINPHNSYHSDASSEDMRRDAMTTIWNAIELNRLQNIVNNVHTN